MKILEPLRICGLIIFNAGMGGLATLFPMTNFKLSFWWTIIAIFGNLLIVSLTWVKDK